VFVFVYDVRFDGDVTEHVGDLASLEPACVRVSVCVFVYHV